MLKIFLAACALVLCTTSFAGITEEPESLCEIEPTCDAERLLVRIVGSPGRIATGSERSMHARGDPRLSMGRSDATPHQPTPKWVWMCGDIVCDFEGHAPSPGDPQGLEVVFPIAGITDRVEFDITDLFPIIAGPSAPVAEVGALLVPETPTVPLALAGLACAALMSRRRTTARTSASRHDSTQARPMG